MTSETHLNKTESYTSVPVEGRHSIYIFFTDVEFTRKFSIRKYISVQKQDIVMTCPQNAHLYKIK